MFGWYVLDSMNRVVPEPDIMKAAKFKDDFPRRVVAQHNFGESLVSTVFTCINLNFEPDGPPHVFETLIRGGPYHDHMRRYSTWQEAEAGHRTALKAISRRLGRPVEDAVPVAPENTPANVRTRFERLDEDDVV